MYIPRNSKFKKQQKGKHFNCIYRNNSLNQLHFGSVGLKALSFNRLTSKQIETLRKTLNKLVKKTGRLVIHAFPNIPVSQKPLEIRMGKGKGNVDRWEFKVKPGFILCEIITDQIEIAKKALTLIKKRMNIKTKIIVN
jgi:large subunit ribosomal protein L16